MGWQWKGRWCIFIITWPSSRVEDPLVLRLSLLLRVSIEVSCDALNKILLGSCDIKLQRMSNVLKIWFVLG